MEPSLKWAGNPNITVVVKAFGLKATLQVTTSLYYLLSFLSESVLSFMGEQDIVLQTVELFVCLRQILLLRSYLKVIQVN